MQNLQNYNVDDSSPSDCRNGRFSYQEIFPYLREGKNLEYFERKNKQALRKRVKFFAVKDAHLYYVGRKFILGVYSDSFTEQHHSWASEASPTLGCSIEISRDICRYVCLSWSKKRRRNYVGQTRACSKSVLGGKIRPVTPVLLISTISYGSFSMDGIETFT